MNFVRSVGWPSTLVVGDNSSILQMYANAKAGAVGLSA